MKRIFFLFITIAVLVSLVPLCVFADYQGVYILDNIPSGSVLRYSTEETPQTYAYWGQANGNDYYLNAYRNSDISNSSRTAYFFLTHSNSAQSVNQHRICLAVEGQITDDDETIIVSVGTSRNGGADYTIRKSGATYDAVTNLTWYYPSTYISCMPYCNVAYGDNETQAKNNGLAELRTAINNGTAGGASVSRNVTIEIKPNNIAYIGYSSGTATFDFYLNGNSVFYYYATGICNYWFEDSLPSQVTTVNQSTGTQVIFNGVGDKTTLGASQHGQKEIELTGTRYLVVSNPYNPTGDYNVSVFVTLSDYVSCVQYPLTTTLSGGVEGLRSTYSPDQYYVANETSSNSTPDYLEYNVDGQGNITTSPAISVPSGGNNLMPEQDDGGIDGFIEKILNLFTAPIRYIQNLVDSGSSFMAWISQLWYWLPPEVGVIIGSALAVIVVIGAIKLLWK